MNPIPDDFRHFLTLVREGRVFEVADWVKAGRIVRLENSSHWAHRALLVAIKLGNHAMVQVLLRDDGWGEAELNRCLWDAMRERRVDLVDLLVAAGASPQTLYFGDLARTADVDVIKRFVSKGVDPIRNHGFARALDSIRSKSLLGVYRELVGDLPQLENELHLALYLAVQGDSVRWVSLLVWAGADPRIRVPRELDRPDDDDLTTAAIEACWRGDLEIFDALKLRPSAADLKELLHAAVVAGSLTVLDRLLEWTDDLNNNDRGGSDEIADLMRLTPPLVVEGKWVSESRCEKSREIMRRLLEHGARWRPDPEELKSVRRGLLKLDGLNLKRILVLLMEFPGALLESDFTELVRTASVQRKLVDHDKYFARRVLRKS